MTLNNYTEAECDILQSRVHEIFKYFVAAKEVGESLTPHLQCYGELANKLTITGLKAKMTELGLPRFHFEVAKADARKNIEYCTKDGEPWFEHGNRPKGQGKRTDLDQLASAIQAGEHISDIIKSHPASYIKYFSGINQLYAFCQTPRDFMTIGYWLYGETGTGKSRWAHENFPNAYWKLPDCRWFDGYRGEDTVVIDDYRPTKDMSFQMILRMVDRYPMKVEVKGGHINFAPKRILFTTPKDIPETFQHLDWIQENLEQLIRRFPHRIRFGPGLLTPHLRFLEPEALNQNVITDGEETKGEVATEDIINNH